jgi:hypothetical protein
MTSAPPAIGSKPSQPPSGQRRLDGHAVNGHLEVAARDTVTVNLTLHRCGFAQSGVDFCPVDISRE